jgi:hypothetical protein
VDPYMLKDVWMMLKKQRKLVHQQHIKGREV